MSNAIRQSLKWGKMPSRFWTNLRLLAIPGLFFLIIFITSSAIAENEIWAMKTQPDVPEGAKVVLEFDRDSYFIGENVLVHFVVVNTGKTPFTFSTGGDYRGAIRHLRFKVTATDQAGRESEDPDPSTMCMGGMGGSVTLKPGEKFVQTLPLMRYCQIDKPGTYTIRATHDLGWNQNNHKQPVGQTEITFKMPSPSKAEEIVSAMEKLSDDPSAAWNAKTRDYKDFTCLRAPVYVEPLLKRAIQGNIQAFEGLGLIATPQATQALIKLANNSNPKIALSAGQALCIRLPALKNKRENYFQDPAVRQRLAGRSWSEEFAPETRAIAKRFLKQKDVSHVECGATILKFIGTKQDVPAIMTAIDIWLKQLSRPRNTPTDNILNDPSPVLGLIWAIDALRSRGFTLPQPPAGDAATLLYFKWITNKSLPRPANWRKMVETYITAKPYLLREAAIGSIPASVPEDCIEFVMQGLGDPDFGVRQAACLAAGNSGNKIFIKPLLNIVATSEHEWLLRAASDAAEKLGAGSALLKAWANRLSEDKLYQIGLDYLQTVLVTPKGGYGGRTDLSGKECRELGRAWEKFIADHIREIDQGKKYELSDPAVSPALVGRARSWRLPDGTTWPAKP